MDTGDVEEGFADYANDSEVSQASANSHRMLTIGDVI